MTKTQIYNIALSQFGKMCTETEVTSANQPYEVKLCETGYRGAVLRVLGECDWDRYTDKILMDYSYDFPEGGWRHGFLLPQGILRIIPTVYPYKHIRDKFLTNEDRPEVYALMDSFDEELATDDFCILVGLALAIDLCINLAPNNSNTYQQAMQKYSWTLTPMMAAQSVGKERSIEEGGAYNYDLGLPDNFRRY